MSDLPETPVSEQARPAGPVSSRELDPEEIPSTDIVFECPHCAKSLSIDQRGAGLVIRCTQCGEPVTVPIPEGMAIEDFDATPEELSAQLLNTRQALSRAQRRISELEAEVAAFAAFREETKRARTAAEEAVSSLRLALARTLREQEAAFASAKEALALAVPPPPVPEKAAEPAKA